MQSYDIMDNNSLIQKYGAPPQSVTPLPSTPKPQTGTVSQYFDQNSLIQKYGQPSATIKPLPTTQSTQGTLSSRWNVGTPTTDKPPVSMSGGNAEQVVPHFDVNTENFGEKNPVTDIVKGTAATLGNAVLATPKAAEQAIRMLGQVKDIFTQNGAEGIYGKYAEGVDSIMQGLNETLLKPVVGALSDIGNVGLGQKSPAEVGNMVTNTVKGLTKFGIEQPTNAALAVEQLGTMGQGKFDASGNPIKPTDLIHEIGAPVVEKATEVIKPIITNIIGKANDFANHLEQQSMRLTPVAKAKLGARLDEVSQFNIDNKVTGNPQTRLAKIDKIVTQYNDTLDEYLRKEVPDNTVDTKVLADRLNNLKVKYASSDVADLEGAGRQIDSAIKRLGVSSTDKLGSDSIVTARLNNLKSSYYDHAYGNQIGSGLTDEVQGDIARLYKEAIEENLKGAPPINGQTIQDFNHDYGNSIISKKILTTATGRPQIGPIGRLTAKGVGVVAGSVAGVPGEIVGGLYGDKVAQLFFGTHARSIISDLLSGESEPYLPDSMTNSAMGNSTKNSIIGNTISKVKDYVKNPKMGNSLQDVSGTQPKEIFNADAITDKMGIPNPAKQKFVNMTVDNHLTQAELYFNDIPPESKIGFLQNQLKNISDQLTSGGAVEEASKIQSINPSTISTVSELMKSVRGVLKIK
jgi:hypothetical protein